MMNPRWQKKLVFARDEELLHRQSLTEQDSDRSPFWLAGMRTGNSQG